MLRARFFVERTPLGKRPIYNDLKRCFKLALVKKRNLCVFVKSCKRLVVFGDYVLPRVADFARILELS